MNWDSSIFWGIIGIFSTIFFGFIFSYIFYRKGLKQKKIVCIIEPTTLISNNLSNYKNLKILYNGENIQALTSTKVVLKNIGNDKIEPSDITPSDPIVITTSGKFLPTEDFVLDVNSTNPKVKSSLEYVDDSTFNLKFDFFPPECELSLTLLHSGNVSITGDLKIGNFNQITINNGLNSSETAKTMQELYILYISYLTKFLYIVSIVILAIFPLYILYSDNYNASPKDTVVIILFPLAAILIIILTGILNKFDKK